MKFLGIIMALISFAGCDPYGFGFKKNPAYILDEAFGAIHNQNVESFLDSSGREALCIYGNRTGIAYLKEKLVIDTENIEIEPKMLTERSFKSPQYVGYWSYYNERYMVNINSKESKKTLIQVIVDCDFGSDVKDKRYQNLNKNKFDRKECRLVKVLPYQFKSLPMPAKCEQLQVPVSDEMMSAVL